MNQTGQSIEERGKVIQLVCGALIMGVVVFMAILFVVADWDLAHTNLTLFSLLGMAFAFFSFVVAVILPKIIAANAIQVIADEMKAAKSELNSDEGRGRIANQFVTTTIIRYAIIEGAVFLNLMLFFLDHSMICLAAAAIGLALMVLYFPLPGRMMNWVQNQISDHTGKFSV